MTRISFTDRCFVRSHGRHPSRTALSSWAFQASRSETAFERDLFGEIVWAHLCTLAEAKRKVRASFDGALFVAVLP